MPPRSRQVPQSKPRPQPRQREFAQVTVTALGGLGDGIARLDDGRVVLVPDAVPGDRLVIEQLPQSRGTLRGKIAEILTPSPHRQTPPCPVFATCGGCNWQHIELATQSAEKASFLAHALGKSLDVAIAAQPVPPWRHRRRVRLHLRMERGKLVAGMMARASHEIVAIDDCLVLTEPLSRLLRVLPDAVRPWLKVGEAYAVEGAEGVLVAIHGLPHDFRVLPEATALMVELGIAGLSLSLGRHQDRAGLAEVTLPETLDAWPVHVDAAGFCQATEAGNRAIRQAVTAALDAVGPVPRIQEFFAGSGNLSTLCIGRAPVVRTIELDEAAVARARLSLANAPEFQLFCGDVDELVDAAVPGELWLLDPGRTGARGVAQAAANQGPQHIVYVSCALDTLRRDLQILQGAGYTVQSATVIDAFPHTPHVEAVVRLAKA
jgi:23S rRNA (uracil1939-C5)-methyltransferase